MDKDYWEFFGSHLEQFKYIEENYYDTWTKRILNTVVGCGDLETIKYAREKGFEWSFSTGVILVRRGDLESLKYIHLNGYEFDLNLCKVARKAGQLECLKFLNDIGVYEEI